jgi:prolycopene isomerase
MEYEVIVVGGGIGGLTVAAVLAARGVNVCLLERQSQVGGCVATVEHAGYQFEPTFGLYSGWEPRGIYDRLCAELGVKKPISHLSSPAYVVRLPDGVNIPRSNSFDEFEDVLRNAFPECAEAATTFYRNLSNAAGSEQSGKAEHREGWSLRFRAFVDTQLQMLAQCSIDECTYQFAASVLDPQRSFWRIEGGMQSFVDLLVGSFKRSGGKLRLNSPVLRLAFGSDGLPTGVDLLNGERVVATRAIVSNLTIWDTYGKLIGPSRTPRQISSTLKELRAWGVYQMFLTIKPEVASRVSLLPLLIASELTTDSLSDSHEQFVFSSNSGSATAVVSAYTPAEDWFSFHEDREAFETRDRSLLETLWARLHTSMPELGDGVELIETATPQTFYEDLRRRFGMIGRPTRQSLNQSAGETPYLKLQLAGDTVAGGLGIEGVVESAWHLADRLWA